MGGFLGVNWDLSKGLGSFLNQTNGDIRYENGSYQGSQQERNDRERAKSIGPDPNLNKPVAATAGADPGTAAMIAAMNRQTAELRRQIDAMPKLPTYNTSDAWARAGSTAAASVNPVYQDKLNNKLAEFQAGIRQKQTQVTRGKEDLDTKLTQDIEDITTNKTRTAEDTAGKIAESQYQEGRFQDIEGTQFDKENRQARTDLAAAGLTESGLGQQKLEEQEASRNESSTDQVRTFKNEQQAQELFKTRTFEDLGKTQTRKTDLTAREKGDLDIQLGDYIENTNIAETQYRWQNESERLDALFGAQQNAYNNDIRQFLAGLQGQGWRAQDIQLANQVYRTY
jgi:hypothetical protein